MGLVDSYPLMRRLCRVFFFTLSLFCSEFDDEGLFEKITAKRVFFFCIGLTLLWPVIHRNKL